MVQALDGGQYPAKKVQPGWMRESVVAIRRENPWKNCLVWSFTNNVSVFMHVSLHTCTLRACFLYILMARDFGSALCGCARRTLWRSDEKKPRGIPNLMTFLPKLTHPSSSPPPTSAPFCPRLVSPKIHLLLKLSHPLYLFLLPLYMIPQRHTLGSAFL